MAACGLNPGRSNSSDGSLQINQRSSSLNQNGRRSLNEIVKNGHTIPSLQETNSNESIVTQPKPTVIKTNTRFSSNNVCVMIDFALKLMQALEWSNFSEFFKQYDPGLLRIGISYGEVMAGVIGSSKPMYDVWGNTVNMASRMESTGIPGYIQVTEETAKILESFGYALESRGEVMIKGRGRIPTYFVKYNDKYEPIKIDNISEDISSTRL